MHRFALAGLALTFVGILAGVTLSSSTAVAGKACTQTKFDTKLIADACKKDQGAAKKAMKAFVKKAKKTEASLDCKSCHQKLAPSYDLKPDAVEHFKRLGGK